MAEDEDYGLCCSYCFRSRGFVVLAGVYSVVLATVSTMGFLYLAVTHWLEIPHWGNGAVATVWLPDDLHLPSYSTGSFQKAFASCGAIACFIWLVTAIILLVGFCQRRRRLYLPWLIWSGLLAPLALFGIIHLLLSERTIYEEMLAEYVILCLTCILNTVFPFAVHRHYIADMAEEKQRLTSSSRP